MVRRFIFLRGTTTCRHGRCSMAAQSGHSSWTVSLLGPVSIYYIFFRGTTAIFKHCKFEARLEEICSPLKTLTTSSFSRVIVPVRYRVMDIRLGTPGILFCLLVPDRFADCIFVTTWLGQTSSRPYRHVQQLVVS